MKKFKNVGKPVKKFDGVSLAVGAAKFTDDFELKDALHLSILYSPYAHAEIEDIDVSEALAVDGVVDVLTYQNVPQKLFTTAGQGYPEPSPYDSRILDRKVRFVGDRVAVVVAESKRIAEEAKKKIKVKYRVLEPIFDPERAMDDDAPMIPDPEAHMIIPAKYDPKRNLAAELDISYGDLEAGFEEADFIEEHTYWTHYGAHAMLEPHAAAAYIDEMGRLVVISTTQVPFHARRILSMVLDIPLRKIRVIKPHLGGGFGGKQEIILEPLVALVTWRHQRPSKIVLSREEVFVSTRVRRSARLRLKTGVKKDGTITALEMDVLLNGGAYGTHGLTVLSNVGSKSLPMLNKVPAMRFFARSVYTNLPVAGAYRGYGATQAYFAINQQIDMIARKLGIDVLDYWKRIHIREGETSKIFELIGEGREGTPQLITSEHLDEAIDLGAKEIGWYDKRGKRIEVEKDRVRGVGMAVAMQGSGIPLIDMAAARMKMNDDGSFNLYVGATDIGTGSDTILAQIAAEVLQIPAEMIIVHSSDTDFTPFDTGAYASSTTYVSGGAVKKTAEKVKEQILKVASEMLNAPMDSLFLEDGRVIQRDTGKSVTFSEIALRSLYMENQFQIEATESYVGEISPPPFIAQFAEVEVDRKTGFVRVIKFVSAVDCGQPINPRLVEGQVEGAVMNGITWALTERYIFNQQGRMVNNNFGEYKIFTPPDMPEIVTIIVDSYEETGPFGAKSVAEVGINGPAPAIANAIYDAVGVRLFDLPFTPEKVYKALKTTDN